MGRARVDEPVGSRRRGSSPARSPRATPDSHDYGFGVSYSTQQYQSAHGASARARRQPPTRAATSARSTEAIAGRSRRLIAIDYGGPLRALRLPDESIADQPARRRDGHAVRRQHARDGHRGAAHAGSRRRGIPGARDCGTRGCRPSARSRRSAGEDLRVERARFLDVGIDHAVRRRLRGRRRAASSRASTIRWSRCSDCPSTAVRRSPGHYYVASAGAVDADGWAFASAARRRSASAARSTTR